jgi:2Fe-2S iron-sulfur cluster binding domain
MKWVHLLIALSADAFLVVPSSRRRPSSVLAVVIQESSSSKFSGAGPVTVDMNMYNLPNLEDIAEEWTAVVVPATPLQEEGIYLQPRNRQEILADTIKVAFPRLPDCGLGLELTELAGGREDGIGITIVSGLVQGGAAESSGVMIGDSVVKVELQKQSRKGNTILTVEESEELFAVQTECLGYDKTVEAILSLPPADASVQETFVLTLKRLRRKPKVKLNLQFPPEMGEENISLEIFAGENLRRAMLVRGVKLNDKLASRFDSGGPGDCGAEGTCATCAVAVVTGQDLLSPAGTQEAQIFRKHPRWRMSCKAVVGAGMKEGELTVRVSPRQWDKQ